jgi:hypothetical protein
MKNNCILLVRTIDRHHPAAESYPVGFPFTYAQIHQMYKGIEGEAWPEIGIPTPLLKDGLASIDDASFCTQYWRFLLQKYPSSTINYLLVGDTNASQEDGYEFIGFDCGYYLSEYNNFSAIYNDVIIRPLDGLQAFRDKLNQHLLFDNVKDANSFLMLRDKLCKDGMPLEDDEQICIFKLFSFRAGA